MNANPWGLKLQPRVQPSNSARLLGPLFAVALTTVFLVAIVIVQGKSAAEAVYALIVSPLSDLSGIAEVLIKTAPLCLTALGLAFAFRANVNNIGAEGQLTMGGIGAAAVAIHVDPGASAGWVLPAMMVAGTAAGMAWAAIPALLRTRLNVSETLTSLMLTYVAVQMLIWITSGPWRDPGGMNIPETKLFPTGALFPPLSAFGWSFWDGTRLNISVLITLLAIPLAWLVIYRSYIGFRMSVGGYSARAASYAGFSAKETVWLSLLVSGACAGLTGVIEVAGPMGQLQAGWMPGYGFVGIIACFLGRLNPLGIALSSVLLALIDVGGSNLQMQLGMPSAMTQVLQGLLLMTLLSFDVFTRYKIVWNGAAGKKHVAKVSPNLETVA